MINKLKGSVKHFIRNIQDSAEEFKAQKTESQKLRLAQDQFMDAHSNYDDSLMNDREKLFIGTHAVDSDVNQRTKTSTGTNRLANNVINIIHEFIESQVDPTIPQPAVVSKRKNNEHLAKVIEDSIKNDLLESDIYRINDENERITPVQGFSLIEVNWDPDYKNHLYRGEISLCNRHPKVFIPQPGVYNLQEMDYFFVMSSETVEAVANRYGVDVGIEGEEHPEINSIDGDSDNDNNVTNKVTVITKWYKDKDRQIGKFTWVNDTVCEDYEKYFARRKDGQVDEYETLEEDVVRSDGSIIPRLSPVVDEDGMPVLDENGIPQMEPTRIKYFCPTRYPFVLRKNVPLNFHFGGQSDVDVIRDQQDAIKKAVTAIEEKVLRGGVIIKKKNGHQVSTKNELYQIISGEMDELAAFQAMNLQADIRQDMEFVRDQYKAAQNTLGITDSYQGKPDSSAKSGVAKQIAINQSSGRLLSKQFNKRNAFKELFEIMFEFKLAFYDDIRPFIKKKLTGDIEYGEFNKYDFIERDAAGVYYYNTDFLFSADAGEGLPKDKMWLMSQSIQFAAMGLLDKVQFWNVMQDLSFPNATEIRDAAVQEQQMAMEQAKAAQQAQMAEIQHKAQMDQAKLENDAMKVQKDFAKIEVDKENNQFNNILEVAKLNATQNNPTRKEV